MHQVLVRKRHNFYKFLTKSDIFYKKCLFLRRLLKIRPKEFFYFDK
jgi:hypothetical protein